MTNAIIDRLAARPRVAMLSLLLFSLAIYLPGVLRLPPVDRTEAIWAEMTRDMVSRHAWLDPRYGEDAHAFRPIGTNWIQGVAAKLAGDTHARDIFVYRLPGAIAVALSAVALFWLAAPLFGSSTALIAAILFAAAPLTTLVAQLALAEGLSLLPATAAMLALLRIYACGRDEETDRLAQIFWIATGCGILVNALLVPILIVSTIIALRFFDDDMWWLGRLKTSKFAPMALVIAAPWLIVRAVQDGVPFSNLGFWQIMEALGGAQDMKLRAWPGTFLLALAFGSLPASAFAGPALSRLWTERAQKSARFLLAWIVSYLVYLELVSSKPGTYMVQPLFPAMALAVAAVVVRDHGQQPAPRGHVIVPPPVAAVIPVIPFAAVYWFTREWPALRDVALGAAVSGLFYLSAYQGRAGQLRNWAITGAFGMGLFAVTLLGSMLPSIQKIWPAKQLQQSIAWCNPKLAVGVIGYREPSIRFLLGADTSAQTIETVLNRNPPLTIVERNSIGAYGNALKSRRRKLELPYTCVWSYNIMRGCNVSFLIAGAGEAATCFQGEAESCETPEVLPNARAGCD